MLKIATKLNILYGSRSSGREYISVFVCRRHYLKTPSKWSTCCRRRSGFSACSWRRLKRTKGKKTFSNANKREKFSQPERHHRFGPLSESARSFLDGVYRLLLRPCFKDCRRLWGSQREDLDCKLIQLRLFSSALCVLQNG